MAEQPHPLVVDIDLTHGGRWTSLRTPRWEWLWHRPSAAAARRAARPGDTFVDAGGVEECFPTVAGDPDHGDVWSRPWQGTADDATVRTSGWTLRRRIASDVVGLTVRYDLAGAAGPGVLHAVHGLYGLSDSARVELPTGMSMRVQDVSGDGGWTSDRWPGADGLDRCGPEDGTARLAVVATDRVRLVDGSDVLELRWWLERGDGPTSLLLWRNLGCWPDGAPYRSIGVEPMLGAATDVDSAEPHLLARSDAGGRLAWCLRVTASTTTAQQSPDGDLLAGRSRRPG